MPRASLMIGLIAAALLAPVPALADADATEAVQFLLSTQSADGSWGETTPRWRDTAVVLETLAIYGQGGIVAEIGRQYMNGQPPLNHDLLSRRLAVGAIFGEANSSLISSLLAGRNPTDPLPCDVDAPFNCPEGGWGIAVSYQTDVLDTGLVLRALAAAGYSGPELAEPIGYLREAQNPDGGWGVTRASDSFLLFSLHALLALQGHDASFDTGGAIPSGIASLKSQALGDGGFSSDPTGPATAYETALAHLVLIGDDPDSLEAMAARTWLETNQLGNGSWNNSPYETALALQALAAADAATVPGARPRMPIDPTATLVVDMNGNGQHATIQAAIDAVRGLGSATSPYTILVVPAASEYAEVIDISGLSWTTIRGLGGAAAVQGVTGCASAAQPCDHVTLEDLRFSGDMTFGDFAGGSAYYNHLWLHRIRLEDRTLRLAASSDPSQVPDFLLSESLIRGFSTFVTRLQIGQDVTTSSSSPDGFLNGVVRDTRFDHLTCDDRGLVAIEGLGGHEDSTLLFENNDFYCSSLRVSTVQNVRGAQLVGIRQGGGRTTFSGNRFYAGISADSCNTTCSHRFISLSGLSGSGPENESQLYVLNNVMSAIVRGSGNNLNSIRFVAMGAPACFATISNERWFVSGNSFEMSNVDEGDLPIEKVRDLTIGCGGGDLNLVIRHRDQELRYGTNAFSGSIEPWPPEVIGDTVGTFPGLLRIPTTAPDIASRVDGHVWIELTTQQICYHSNGETRCIDSAVPAGDPTMKIERLGETSSPGDLKCVKSGKGWKGRAEVLILDKDTAEPVSNVTITGDWSGAYTATAVSQSTDADGIATFTSGFVPSGVFTFTVTSASHATYIHDPQLDLETSDSTPLCTR